MSSKEHSKKPNFSNLFYTDINPAAPKDANETTKEFIYKLVDILVQFLIDSNDRKTKVLDFHQPEDLKKLFDFTIHDEPQDLEALLEDCRKTLKHQVKMAHPHFFNQLTCGLDTVSMAGEWLTATANANMFTYEIAPMFILMEEETMKKMRGVIGWKEGDSILAPGGSISNLYAAMAARHHLFPTYKDKGLKTLPQLVMFTSEQSHYSIKGAGMTMGLGMENVIEVPSDERGRMIPAELEKRVVESKSKGFYPFFVCCTSGTTVMGAFDPIHPCADICEKYGMWLHIDAAWGGGCLLSKKHRQKMDGVERAQSVTWNPHKLMGIVLQCSTIHFRHAGLLISCNQLCADYLFQQDKHYDVQYDTGDKVIQCGRHNDIFKLWLTWKSKGIKGYERHIDRLFELTDYMVQRIKHQKDKFYLILEPECVNVCFWYLPKSVRSMPHNRQRMERLGEITAQIKARMMNKGSLMVGYQPQGDIPNFFRPIVSNMGCREEDIDYLLDEIDRLGSDL